MNRRFFSAAFRLCMLALVFPFSACDESDSLSSPTPSVGIYADSLNWYSLGDGDTCAVDIFYVYPTELLESGGRSRWRVSADDSLMRASAVSDLRYNKGITAGYNFYAPYYGQLVLDYFSRMDEAPRAVFDSVANEVIEAFTYYITQRNNGRPFFLLGHSQGSMMLVEVLKRGMTDEQFDRMVAAYCIGTAITQEELDAYPDRLIPATDSLSVGTLICWNSVNRVDAVSPLFAQTAVGINPITYTTDTAYVPASAQRGYLRWRDGAYRLTPHSTGGQLVGHMMVCPTLDVVNAVMEDKRYAPLFPKGNLHFLDSWQFSADMLHNMELRVRTYWQQKGKVSS